MYFFDINTRLIYRSVAVLEKHVRVRMQMESVSHFLIFVMMTTGIFQSLARNFKIWVISSNNLSNF